MGNVLSIILSYRFYKESKERAIYCKKRKYSDFLMECNDILHTNVCDDAKSKLVKIE